MGLMKRFYSAGKSKEINPGRYDRKQGLNDLGKKPEGVQEKRVVKLKDYLMKLNVNAHYRKPKRKREWVRAPRRRAKFRGKRRWKRQRGFKEA